MFGEVIFKSYLGVDTAVRAANGATGLKAAAEPTVRARAARIRKGAIFTGLSRKSESGAPSGDNMDLSGARDLVLDTYKGT